MNKRAFIVTKWCLCIIMLTVLAFAPMADDPIDKLVTALQQWTDTHPQEKVYLHMDKPYYAVGDTIWFKAYLTSGSRHKFSAISGALYVDLINEKDSVIKDLKLPVTNGMVMGDFILLDDYKQGNYRVRAYTQWMRNAGEDYYFDRTFTVGNPVTGSVIAQAAYNYKTIDSKPMLTASITYASDSGAPLAGKSIDYEIVIDKKVAWRSSAKTDAKGILAVTINNGNGADLSGAYIKTSLKNAAGDLLRRDFPIKVMLTKSDIQFFPEGGNLVSGLTSVMGIKAVGTDGLGIALKGKITDDQKKTVATFQTEHAGMGSFTFRPEIGRSYSADVIFADGSAKSIVLPKPAMEGYLLNVSQTVDTVEIRIKSSSIMSPIVNLVAQTGDELIAARKLSLSNNAGGMRLPKKLFPTGIAQFTLFNANGQPLAERIAFVKSDDALQLSIKSPKEAYSKEAAALKLSALNSTGKPTVGYFSIAVIDETKVPVDEDNERTIFTDLLLTSDLKGHIEKPNYYFKSPTAETNKALDNLMLTQGYRRFTWQDINKTTKPAFEAEGLGTTISGRATTLGDKPAIKASVMLLSTKARLTKLTTTDADGRFKFDGIFLTDSIHFAVQARSAKNSDKIKIMLDSIPKQPVTKNINLPAVNTNISAALKAYMDNVHKQDSLYEKLGMLDKVHRLRQVNINARKPQAVVYAPQYAIRVNESSMDRSYYMKNAENCPNLGICLQGNMGNIMFLRAGNIQNFPFFRNAPMQVILNGRIVSHEDELAGIFDQNVIDPINVIRVDAITTNLPMLALVNYKPSLLIYTRDGGVRRPAYNPSIANVSPKGFNRAREFYSPKYLSSDDARSNLPDSRSTIYWNPRLQTNLDGQGIINFFNADGPGNYRVVIEGLNAEGELGRCVFNYKVLNK